MSRHLQRILCVSLSLSILHAMGVSESFPLALPGRGRGLKGRLEESRRCLARASLGSCGGRRSGGRTEADGILQPQQELSILFSNMGLICVAAFRPFVRLRPFV